MSTTRVLYVADTLNYVIRTVTLEGQFFLSSLLSKLPSQHSVGVVTTLTGTNSQGLAADGPMAYASFTAPTGIAVDSSGLIFITDLNTVRLISAGTTDLILIFVSH